MNSVCIILQHTIFCVLLALPNLQFTQGKSKTETLTGSYCPQTMYNMNPGDTLTFKWQGDQIDCDVDFDGESDDRDMAAVICFKVITFNLPECRTELNFYESWRGSTTLKSYECNDNPVGHVDCAEEGSSMGRLGIESDNHPGARLTVEVYVKLRSYSSYNSDGIDENFTSILVGSIVGVVVLFGLIALLICICVRASRQRATAVPAQATYQFQSGPQSMTATQQQQPPYQTPGGYVHPTTIIQPN
ncbi:hypothetical protein ScPMuIL_008867 [Solemya velum]